MAEGRPREPSFGLLAAVQGAVATLGGSGINLARTADREERFNFGPDYMETGIQVVYRRGQRRPRSMADLAGLKQKLIEGKNHVLEGVAFVKEQDAMYMDLYGRELVDAATAVIASSISAARCCRIPGACTAFRRPRSIG